MFYRPVASKMNALLGRKAAAYSNISILLMTRVTPNTFYNEGSQGSCTETPYAAAWAIGELLVQSWNNTVDCFPGVEDYPDAAHLLGISNASFYQLRTEGAFLASAWTLTTRRIASRPPILCPSRRCKVIRVW